MLMDNILYWGAFAIIGVLQWFLANQRKSLWGLLIPGLLGLVMVVVSIITVAQYSRATSFPLDALLLLNNMPYIVPFVLALTVYFFVKALRKKRERKDKTSE